MQHTLLDTYKNVRVRSLDKRDLESLRLWRNEPKNNKFLRQIPYITPEMQESWFEKYLVENNEFIFAIDEIDHLNEIVGSATLYNFQEDQVEFGKILIGNEMAHGKKIGVIATLLICNIAFTYFKINKVILKCFANNTSALRVYKEVGFVIDDKSK